MRSSAHPPQGRAGAGAENAGRVPHSIVNAPGRISRGLRRAFTVTAVPRLGDEQ